MRKNLLLRPSPLLFPICILFSGVCYGQSLERTLVGSAGTLTSAQGVEVNYSIGELAVATLTSKSNDAFVCTEGFQQKQIVETSKFDTRTQWYSRIRVEAYPNPVRTNLTVYVYDDNFDDYRVDLYDASERLIKQFNLQKNKLVIPMQQYPAGFYWLKFFNTRRQKDGTYTNFKPYKIIKVN
ncbi:Por secretion system C-terminal sorting domain-containing protein [Filimonas lacunae]|uniref:Por secretion system C-terminal sorting domain-containing protein n=1 Tax=Filimonas lacunae TaxID=477680 RepID=A0A1N7K956_9BACT|nr:T9SS type A sorting domain-containing protein [Filimonas lacunae]SIS58082.1 Por secretion system C-terminal sorting domain-containing protein [Filimonas lacunae]